MFDVSRETIDDTFGNFRIRMRRRTGLFALLFDVALDPLHRLVVRVRIVVGGVVCRDHDSVLVR